MLLNIWGVILKIIVIFASVKLDTSYWRANEGWKNAAVISNFFSEKNIKAKWKHRKRTNAKVAQAFGFWWISFLLLQLATEDDSVLTIFWAEKFDNVFLLVLSEKNISKKSPFIFYWLRFIICSWECACVKGGRWVSRGEGEYDYKHISSITLVYVLCIIFANADLKISLMDYIVLSN